MATRGHLKNETLHRPRWRFGDRIERQFALVARMIGRRPIAAGLIGTTMAVAATSVTMLTARAGLEHPAAVALLLLLGIGAVVSAWVIAFAIRAEVHAEARLIREVLTDPLTGLENRRGLNQTLEKEWKRAGRSGNALSVLFIDIDHFKRFNDALGHEAGDDVLIRVARCIADSVRRPGDLVARFGGEEFSVVLPDTQAQSAVALAESIRERVMGMHVPHAASDYRRVTVSIGCATCVPKYAPNANALISTADKQMYAAKHAGRNCVRSVKMGERAADRAMLPILADEESATALPSWKSASTTV